MPRPPKFGQLRMNADLRIPVTADQKQIIQQATANEPEGMAAWARTILLEAAKKQIGKTNRPRKL